MNKIKIIVARLLTLLALGLCLKLIFQKEPFIDESIILAKIIFGGIPILVVAYLWSKAESMYSNYQREIRKEKNIYIDKKVEYVFRKKSGIKEIIIILAAIASIIGLIIQLTK